MRLDMHCHVNEGSMDSRIGVEKYIEILKSKGIDGMVITDHNTYNGYRYWKNHIKGKKHTDFVVLKGIEYDTLDAGHILVIMPEGVKMKLLELRGMPARILIDFVHRNGGVLGPAHPCGEKYMSYANTKCFYKSPEIIQEFDFIETYNACEPEISNGGAEVLATKYNKMGVGGSDAHRAECVGLGYTEFDVEISSETELISAIHKRVATRCGGELYLNTTKEKLGKAKALFSYSFWLYNKSGALYRKHKRKQKAMIENPRDPIDPIEIEYLKNLAKKRRKIRKN